jgi:hypothetical protein
MTRHAAFTELVRKGIPALVANDALDYARITHTGRDIQANTYENPVRVRVSYDVDNQFTVSTYPYV